MQKRTFFIGDVHGCYDELIALIAHAGITDDDDLYFVWDLINKWPKSYEVVEYVRNRPNTYCVKGNHEFFTFFDVEHIDSLQWISESRKNWIKKEVPIYALATGGLDEYREWFESLPHIIERDDFIVVHAGFHPDYGLATPPEIATMIRVHEWRPWYEYYTGDKLVIYGHWAAEWLRVRRNTIWLDTGCCFGGALTAYCLETGEYSQVRANKVYKEPAHWKGQIEV